MGQTLEGRSGIPVGSNSEGELFVHATTSTEHHQAALEGRAFYLPIDGVGTNGAEHLAVMKNTSPQTLQVSSITLFVATFKDSTRIKILLNETFIYAANGIAITPTNLKSGVVGGAVGDFYTIASGGTDITTFGGTSTIGGIYVFERYPIRFEDPGGWIVPTGQVFSLYNVGNDNTFYGGIDFYYHD